MTACFDVQEMFDEYFKAAKLNKVANKTFRLHLWLYKAEEEPLTPEEIEEGQSFFTNRSPPTDPLRALSSCRGQANMHCNCRRILRCPRAKTTFKTFDSLAHSVVWESWLGRAAPHAAWCGL